MQKFCFLLAIAAAAVGSLAHAAAVAAPEAAPLAQPTATPSIFSGSQQQELVPTAYPPISPSPPLGVVDDGSGAVVVVSPEFGATSPMNVAPCSLSSPELNECIRGLIQTIAPKLKYRGLPEYKMGSIDPYFYKRGIFRYANDGIQGGLLIKNMEIYGISDLKINSVAANFTENGFVIKLGAELPQLKAGGHFKADVKFGGLRLVPKGPFNITIDNIKATILTDGHIEQLPNGQQRLSLHRLNANVNIGDARIIANGIFTDRNLNAMILNLVNENLPEITRVGIPATREQWAPILVAHINEFFAEVPIEKFLVQ